MWKVFILQYSTQRSIKLCYWLYRKLRK